MAISVTNVSAVTVTVVVGLPAMKLVAKLRKRPLTFGFSPPFAGTSSAINKELSIASFLSSADGTAVIKILFVPIKNLKNGAKFKTNEFYFWTWDGWNSSPSIDRIAAESCSSSCGSADLFRRKEHHGAGVKSPTGLADV
jgi:hypothetical protein